MKKQNRAFIQIFRILLCFLSYRMDAFQSRSNATTALKYHADMKLLSLFVVCERLFDELVKEWLKNRYTVVSGSFREVNGRKVRIRKGHLRRKC